MDTNWRREIHEAKRKLADIIRRDIDARNEEAKWDAVARTSRGVLGDALWSEFVELCYFACEQGDNAFMQRYMNDSARPAFLLQVRGLLAQHMAVMRR